MNNTNIFEVAVRNKTRFPFKGLVSTEDLWDMPVRDLDTVFKTLNSQIKQVKEESLLNTKSKEDAVLDMQIEIVKYIVATKLDEENARLQIREKREQKQKILSILADKQEESLQNKSEDDLKKMLVELGD